MRYLEYTHDREKLSKSTRRTLRDLGEALNDLLKEECLEKISVKDICDRSLVSKSSFYNYFDDKIDLLWYIMWFFENEVDKFIRQTRGTDEIDPKEKLFILVKCIVQDADFIYKLNAVGGQFHNEWTKYQINKYKRTVDASDNDDDLPEEIRIQVNMYAVHTAVIYCIRNNIPIAKTLEYVKAIMQ